MPNAFPRGCHVINARPRGDVSLLGDDVMVEEVLLGDVPMHFDDCVGVRSTHGPLYHLLGGDCPF